MGLTIAGSLTTAATGGSLEVSGLLYAGALFPLGATLACKGMSKSQQLYKKRHHCARGSGRQRARVDVHLVFCDHMDGGPLDEDVPHHARKLNIPGSLRRSSCGGGGGAKPHQEQCF